MELNVGDYVRTNDGYINKIKKVNQWNILVDARDLFGEEINIANNEIIKSSPNIIDLIEVGDYVNGTQVVGMSDDNPIINVVIPYELEEKDIKSVLTHEQFEAMKYVVGDTNVKD